MSITTKKGDAGKTALRFGRRVSKSDLRVEAYGTVDELGSQLGFSKALLRSQDPNSIYIELLDTIQSQLLSVGGDLATTAEDHANKESPLYKTEFLDWLDEQTVELEKQVKMDGFVLPGTNMFSASMHVARTVCRRAERRTTTLAESGDEPAVERTLPYLNRLSDFLWLLAEKTA
jgi:cob(I)alamin adenosyltransferase